MDPSQFITGRTRETNLRRDALGRWFDGPDLLEHPKLIKAFDSWLDRADDGRFCLRNDINWAYVTLEGPPLFVRTVATGDDPVQLLLRLSDGREEPLQAHTLRQGPEGALYCDARGGRLVARFDRHAMQQLESLLQEDDQGVYLLLGNERIRPQVVSDPLEPAQPTP
jgi:hypothetical protein